MPHTIRTPSGQEVEVITAADLTTATWRLLRWGGSALLAAVVAATFWVSQVETRLVSVESRAAANASRVESMRAVMKSVDSLVVVVGNQTELLREISRRVQ